MTFDHNKHVLAPNVNSPSDDGMSRRRFLTTSGKATAAGLAVVNAPYVIAKSQTTLRVIGTHVTLQEEIRKQAMADLGINLVFEARGESELVQKATTNPNQFDLYEQWTDSIRTLWQANAIQAIDVQRLNIGMKSTISQRKGGSRRKHQLVWVMRRIKF